MSDCTYPSFSGTQMAPRKTFSAHAAVAVMMTVVAIGIGCVGYSFGRSVAEVQAAVARRRPEPVRPMVVHPIGELAKAKPSPMGEPVVEKAKAPGKKWTPKMAGTYLQVAAVNPAGQKPIVDKLTMRGYTVRVAHGGQGHTVRVLVGPVQSAEQLQTLAVRLSHDGYRSFRKQL